MRRSDERGQDSSRNCAKRASPFGPKEIAVAIGKGEASVRYLLGQMVKAGEVKKIGRGKYRAGKSNANPTPFEHPSTSLTNSQTHDNDNECEDVKGK